jgi:hypothetical protein
MKPRRVGKKDIARKEDVVSCLCNSSYRGWKIFCSASELPTLRQQIDHHWATAIAKADGKAGRDQVFENERLQRVRPKEWPLK